MSLFKARDWWSTWAGNDEEFDKGCICVANIDNSLQGHDKIIVGSLHGVLRIFSPKCSGFKPEDLMVETQMQQPILQVATGKFVSGTENIHLAILHPRKLSVYTVMSVTGSVEHGNYYAVKMAYEHILERTSHSMTYGQFGGVTAKDFICVQSMDGVLSFFEQETFTFSRFLPNFIIPGPIAYVSNTDSFITSSSSCHIECFKYQSLAVASDKLTPKSLSGKKVMADWSTNIGEYAIDIQFVAFSGHAPSILVLGERSLFSLLETGGIHFMKKLDYSPSCLFPYGSFKNGKLNTLIGSHTNSLLVYEDVTLVWAAQLPHTAVAVKLANFNDLNSVIVTLDEYGHLYCSYLGTDPSLFVAPPIDSRDLNYQELDRELKQLQKTIKQSSSSQPIVTKKKEELLISAEVANQMDEISQAIDIEKEADEVPPSISVKVHLTSQAGSTIENIKLDFSTPFPIACNKPTINIPIIGDRSASLVYPVSFYTCGGSIPSSLHVTATATYFNDSEAPRVVQCTFQLPLQLICRSCSPVKQAEYKLTLDTNKDPVNLSDLYQELLNDDVIPTAALGIEYFGGPVVTILSSKSSNRYRLQCDQFEGLWLILSEHVCRLRKYFDKRNDGSPFKPSFVGSLPLNEYFQLIDSHFEARQDRIRLKEHLSQRAHQFRVIQRRLLTRFKDKTPAPLANLDILLEGTYRQLLALGEAAEDVQRQCIYRANALSCGTRLINLLIKLWIGMNDKEYDLLQSCLSCAVSDSDDQGWEEVTDTSITFLLKTCLAKSSKDQNVTIQALCMPKDTGKLKKHVALMCERLNKGAKLDLNPSIRASQNSIFGEREPLATLSESQEDSNDSTDEIPNEVTVNAAKHPLSNGNQSDTNKSEKKLPKLEGNLHKRLIIESDSKEAQAIAYAASKVTSSSIPVLEK